jgi:hypothetical protein
MDKEQFVARVVTALVIIGFLVLLVLSLPDG